MKSISVIRNAVPVSVQISGITRLIRKNVRDAPSVQEIVRVGAITGKIKSPYVIDSAKCIKCGACLENCSFGAVYTE